MAMKLHFQIYQQKRTQSCPKSMVCILDQLNQKGKVPVHENFFGIKPGHFGL